jgi:CheY-like chemotaxis protein
MNVLVIDDDPDSISIVEEGLRGVGRVSSCASSGEARRVLQSAAADSIDLLVIDLRMEPDLADIDLREGLELSHWCHRCVPAIPRLLVTAELGAATSREARDSGALGLVCKPLDLQWLRSFVLSMRALKQLSERPDTHARST